MTHWQFKALLVLASLISLSPLAVNAQTGEDRVAFIIGNGGYPKSLALKNPLNDATAIEKQLASLGFETKSYKDLKVAEVSGLRQQMESRLKRDSVLFFYYAGHGVQIDGRNYLLPVDATLNDGDKASRESLYLGDILHAIERMRPKIAVVILDACRDNPFVEWHPKLSHFEENLHPNLSHPNRLSCLIFEQGWARSDQRGNFEQITQTCPSRQGLHPAS